MKPTENQLERLAAASQEASRAAYAPYSKFPVGAAVLFETGEISTGCNVENASFGLTICAERNAVFQAVARGHRNLIAVSVYTPTQEPVTPCGACRQVLNEFGPDAVIVSHCEGPDRLVATVSDLLPNPFGPKNLA